MNFPVSVDIPVAWGEMDAFGHVNNVVFFRYFETVRIAYFERLLGSGFSSPDFMPILANTECSYKRPVVFPDTLQAEAAVSHVGKSSFTMEYRLLSRKQEAVVAEGKAVVVNVDPATGRGRPLEEEMKQKIEALQAD